jgi:hypothetical protein
MRISVREDHHVAWPQFAAAPVGQLRIGAAIGVDCDDATHQGAVNSALKTDYSSSRHIQGSEK